MKSYVCLATVALLLCGLAWAQDPAVAPVRSLPANPPNAQQQGNAASAAKDNSGTSGDQMTKPAGAKGSTLIGCLSGPDKDGRFMLRSMTHRTGVRVLGPDDLKNDAGSKVKLTGQWQPLAKGNSEMRRFQVTEVEVMSQSCSVPSETTPESKTKRGKPTTYNAPSGESAK